MIKGKEEEGDKITFCGDERHVAVEVDVERTRRDKKQPELAWSEVAW